MNKEKLKNHARSIGRVFVIYLIILGCFWLLVWMFHLLTN